MEMGLAAFVPAAFLVAALIFTRRRSLIVRLAWTLAATLVGLPIGLLSLFAPILAMTPPNYDPNPGTGVIALPLIVGWVFILLLWLGWLISLGSSRYFPAIPGISRKNSDSALS
jgi:hypothetical protein